jgi:type II secretory pathway pseudopilin PulG
MRTPMRAGERRKRRGAVLLEALVALVIVATAGAAVAALAVESGQAVQRTRSTEAELRRADAFFAIVALWPREDLDRHFGEHQQGPWRLRVERPVRSIYQITLTDSLGTRALLRTVLYRPEPPRDTL